MTRGDMSPRAVSQRLREASGASRLGRERRLDAKIDMSAAAVSRRLRTVARLREFCLKLVALGEANGLGRARRDVD